VTSPANCGIVWFPLKMLLTIMDCWVAAAVESRYAKTDQIALYLPEVSWTSQHQQ
jgi:hypothetical protein